MPFIPANNVVQAELVFNWDGQIVENVLHYQIGGGWTITLMDELGGKLVTWWSTYFKAGSPTNLTLQNIKLIDLTSSTAPAIDYATGLPLTGTAAAGSLPNNCTCVITKRTPLRGRSYRGRIYHVGLKEDQVTGNTILGASVSTFITNYTALQVFTLAGPLDAELVVVSRYENKFPRPMAVVTQVTHFTADVIVDSQRRRLPGRGA